MIQKSKTTQQPYKNGFLYEAPQIETENIQVPLRPLENEPDSDMVNYISRKFNRAQNKQVKRCKFVFVWYRQENQRSSRPEWY